MIDLADPLAAAELARERNRSTPIDAVLAVDEAGVLAAAHIAERLGLRGSPVPAVAATRNKLAVRERLSIGRVGQPRWWPWAEGEVPARVRFPAVVKPLDQAGSRGVIRVEDRSQLLEAGRRVRQTLRSDPGCATSPEGIALLVEHFVAGPEVAVEAVLAGGRCRVLAVYDKPEPLDGPYFEETIYTVPSSMSQEQLSPVLATVEDAARALGLTEGPIHAELRLGGPQPCLIDLAARSIGGRCSRVLRFRSGRSLEEILLLAVLGDDLGELTLEPGISGVMMMPIPRAGTLRAVPGLSDALARPGIDSVEMSVPMGARVLPLPEGDRYLGFIFARGEAREAVATELRTAYRQLGVVIED